MTRDFLLPRSRAAVVLTMVLLGACSDSVREPTAPEKLLPAIPATWPSRSFSYQNGSQITVYHDDGGWARLDVAAQTLTNDWGIVLPLTLDQTVEFLNDFQGSLLYDQLANGVQGLSGCAEVCIQPTSAYPTPFGSAQPASSGKVIVEVVDTKKVKPNAKDRFGTVVVDLDKTLKELSRTGKKSGGATTLEWPPNCGAALVEVRAAKDRYINGRHAVSDGIVYIYKIVVGLVTSGVVQKLATEMPALSERFVMKSLAQQNMGLMSAIYSGICGQSIPVGTAGYGWYPGAVLECIEARERISFDGGVTWFTSIVRMCQYHAAH